MLAHFTAWLSAVAHQLPLVVFVGIFELVAPIPSQSILVLAGSIALVQGKSWLFLLLLVFISAIARTIGSWLIYTLAYKAEDVVVHKWGKKLGVTEKHIEHLSKRFNKGYKDIFAMILIRALPIFPGVPIDVACGIIKMRRNDFLLGTFIGLIPHNILVLTVGYTGGKFLGGLVEHMDSIGSIIQLVLFVAVAMAILGWLWKLHRKHSH